MPVIAFSSPKGGAGKTTAATLLATVLAGHGASVAVIDADPNKNVVDWAKLPGKPASLSVIGEVGEENIVDAIEEDASAAAFVIVDLEGAANLMVGYAISMADFVVIPVQGSQLDAKQAARQIRLIASQERISGRSIPFAVLLTRVSPAIQPRTQRHIEDRFREMAVPVLKTRLYDREAFRAIFSFGGSVASLADKGVSNLTAAIRNADEFSAEIDGKLRGQKRILGHQAASRGGAPSMPVIAFSSPKGGAGKTTAATLLATVLAGHGASVAVIDADPNKNVVDWAKLSTNASERCRGKVTRSLRVDHELAAAL